MRSMFQRSGRFVAVAAIALLGACEGAGEVPVEVGQIGDPLTFASDSASNPTAAFDPSTGRTYIAWVGVEDGENAVFVTAMAPGDATPARAVRANDIPGDAAPHLQAPAQVAVGPEGNVYVLWQNNTPIDGRRFPASDLRLAVSTDGAATFRPAITVNDDAGGTPSSHTFHDLTVADDGTVVVSWIDSRERETVAHQRLPASTAGGEAMGDMHMHHGMAEPAAPAEGHSMVAAEADAGAMPAHHDHASMDTGDAMAEGDPVVPDGPEIRVARSLDGGVTFGANVVVDSASCPCCRTSVAVAPDGAVYVAWRKIYPGDIRDVVVARAEPGSLAFGEPVRVHEDGWVFPGCPHAGPSLAVDADGRLLVGWYTGKEGRQGLWYAASDDGGRTFGEPTPMLTADWVPPSQLRLAVSGDEVWAAWDDRTGDTPVIHTAVGRTGETLRPIASADEVGGDPSLVATDRGAVVAWLDGASVRARRLLTAGR